MSLKDLIPYAPFHWGLSLSQGPHSRFLQSTVSSFLADCVLSLSS